MAKIKPGVMIYFELAGVLATLTDAQAGKLFRAILEYGRDKTIPDLPGRLQCIWPIIQMRLDTDDDRYHQTTARRQYAAYVRWAKKNGEEKPMTFDEWSYHPVQIVEEVID